jgi:hypothetical protein
MSKANPLLGSNLFDNCKALDAHIASLSGDENEVGKIEPTTFETTVHTLHLGDTVTTCHGDATFERDPDEFGLCHFEVSLGPANSKRLIDFLLSLPDEPDDDDERDVKSANVALEPVPELGLHFEPSEWRAKLEGEARYDINNSSILGGFCSYFCGNDTEIKLLEDITGQYTMPTLSDAIDLCTAHNAKRLAGAPNV